MVLSSVDQFFEQRQLFERDDTKALGIKHGLSDGRVNQNLEELGAVQLLQIHKYGAVLAEGRRGRGGLGGHGLEHAELRLKEPHVFVSFLQKRALVHFLVPRHQSLQAPRFLAQLLSALPSQVALRDHRRLHPLAFRLRLVRGAEVGKAEEGSGRVLGEEFEGLRGRGFGFGDEKFWGF